jgi:phosphotransferase system enzyme I (PtsI)
MAETRHKGRTAAPGMAEGTLAVVEAELPARVATGDPAAEAEALRSAVAAAVAELADLGRAATAGPDAAEILGVQIALLEDDALSGPAFAAIAAGRAADEAWREALLAEAAVYASSEDELFRARAADFGDLRDRVLAHLSGQARAPSLPAGAIVAAVDLPPSRFLSVDWSRGGGLVLTAGSPTSHVSVLARGRGVPAIVGLGLPLHELRGPALVDANRGLLVLDPGPDARAEFDRGARHWEAGRAAAALHATRPARTRDGTPVRLLVNLADLEELEGLDPAICDGVGLVRTELLFHGLRELPDEDRQLRAYRRIVEWARGRPVTIRTLDVGGDKPFPGFHARRETNPFLGVRGLRLSFEVPHVFRTQLRALARAAAHGDVKVMLPMVTLPAELDRARAMLDVEVSALRALGVEARRPSLGMMVEVPAAAIAADLFTADFFSIGSNDLIQYVTAVGRDVDSLADLTDPRQPAVLRLVRQVVEAARARGIEVSLCGDAAADPAAIPALLAAGLRTLSVAPALVGTAKQAIAETDLRRLEEASPWVR